MIWKFEIILRGRKTLLEWNPRTWFLAKFQLKTDNKAIDGSNYTTTFVANQIVFNLEHLFDSERERSVYRFGNHSVSNGGPSREIPWSAELPPKNCLRPIDWLTVCLTDRATQLTPITHPSYTTLAIIR